MNLNENMSLEEIREVFAGDRFATAAAGAVIEEARPGYAKCCLTLTDRHRNAMGGVMGGVHFTLADFAFAVAANVAGVPTVSVASSIQFLAAVKGERLTAQAHCRKDGVTSCFYEVEVEDDTGRLVALVTITANHIRR